MERDFLHCIDFQLNMSNHDYINWFFYIQDLARGWESARAQQTAFVNTTTSNATLKRRARSLSEGGLSSMSNRRSFAPSEISSSSSSSAFRASTAMAVPRVASSSVGSHATRRHAEGPPTTQHQNKISPPPPPPPPLQHHYQQIHTQKKAKTSATSSSKSSSFLTVVIENTSKVSNLPLPSPISPIHLTSMNK